MKNIALLFALTLLMSCQQKKETTNNESPTVVVIENFDWLLGDWKRTNDEENRETYESWAKKSATEYLGIGFTLQENDTVSKEKIQLNKLNELWQLQVITKEDADPTIFKVSSFDSISFVCENAANEFPKKIRYSIAEKKLLALISGDGLEIPFEFEKIE